MKHLLWMYSLLLVILFCGAVTYEGFESSPSTLFKDIANKKVFLLVYIENCQYCTELKPAWDAASKKQPDKMVAINASKTDPATNLLTSKLNVKGYPSMFVMDNGKIVKQYEGGRTEQDLLAEVNSM
jgi:thiol-disulfide isomerase/thioredoxin